MSTFFLIAAIIAMVAVLATLGAGLVGMARDGEFNAKYGNALMRWRVGLQGLAIVLFALALLTSG
ncbi:MAG TPA: twin transmembrane helix small protein [Alphaproteobacteria bacterium]|nr:twin transmembrane helix small protein [Alphaproteobacteria bacterium]